LDKTGDFICGPATAFPERSASEWHTASCSGGRRLLEWDPRTKAESRFAHLLQNQVPNEQFIADASTFLSQR